MKSAKGHGSFRNLFMYSPNVKGRASDHPVVEVAAKG